MRIKGTAMKKIIHGAIAFLLGALVFVTSNTLAGTDTKPLDESLQSINLVVNGNPVTLKDSNGNVVEPFVVDGSTCLPIRSIAEVLGTSVDWDGSTNTVYIGHKPGQKKLSELIDFSYQSTGATYLHKISKMRMNTGDYADDCIFSSNFGFLEGSSSADYQLNAGYKRIKGCIFLNFDSRGREGVERFIIWGDDNQIYKSADITSAFTPTEFDVDITGVNVLRIEAEFERGLTVRTIGLSNTVLEP